MIIDCELCVARNTDACGDCIVTAICGDGHRATIGGIELGDDERMAIDALSMSGLVAPLRLVLAGEDVSAPPGSRDSEDDRPGCHTDGDPGWEGRSVG